ncbi:MAG: hypothetical protein Q7R87_01490 [Nanoarchaeota archaeon]|nr:hypothetical protein [Nanoarchaeota archaeon]
MVKKTTEKGAEEMKKDDLIVCSRCNKKIVADKAFGFIGASENLDKTKPVCSAECFKKVINKKTMKKEDKIKQYKKTLKQVEKELADFKDKKKWFEKERGAYIRNLKKEIDRLETRRMYKK